MSFFKIVCGVGLGSMISGCSLFAPVKMAPVQEYQLTAQPITVTQHYRKKTTLFVSMPYAVGVNNSTDMVYSTRPYQLNAFAKNRWAAPPTQMLQPLIIEAIHKTHYFSALGASPALGGYDKVLTTDLMQFHQVFAGCHSFFRLTLRAQLTNAHTNRVMASKEFSARCAAPFNTPYGGVIAANRAATIVLSELATWVVTIQ